VNASSRKFHNEQQIVGDEPAFGPDFNGGEVNGREHIPMRFRPDGKSLHDRLLRFGRVYSPYEVGHLAEPILSLASRVTYRSQPGWINVLLMRIIANPTDRRSTIFNLGWELVLWRQAAADRKAAVTSTCEGFGIEPQLFSIPLFPRSPMHNPLMGVRAYATKK
jgi:hypothetical protein